jgi:hypothetical protein
MLISNIPPKGLPKFMEVGVIPISNMYTLVHSLLEQVQKPDASKALIVRMLQQIDAVSRRNTFTLYSCHCG